MSGPLACHRDHAARRFPGFRLEFGLFNAFLLPDTIVRTPVFPGDRAVSAQPRARDPSVCAVARGRGAPSSWFLLRNSHGLLPPSWSTTWRRVARRSNPLRGRSNILTLRSVSGEDQAARFPRCMAWPSLLRDNATGPGLWRVQENPDVGEAGRSASLTAVAPLEPVCSASERAAVVGLFVEILRAVCQWPLALGD